MVTPRRRGPSSAQPASPSAGSTSGQSVARVVAAGLAAAVVSGIPSTVWALVKGDDPLDAVRAAGSLLPGRRQRPSLLGGIVAHAGVSGAWTVVLALVARRWRLDAASGALAGLAIAAVDLGVVGRRYPAIAALDVRGQLADHVVFGAVLGHLLPRPVRDGSMGLPGGARG